MPQIGQPLYRNQSLFLLRIRLSGSPQQYQQCSHKCKKDTVHISPGKVKIHLPESLLVQAKRHQKTHTVNLPGEAVNAVSAQLLIVQQKHQDRETDSQTDSQRKITAILQPHMSQRKTDAAFLSLLRDEHTAELVQQIRKSRKEAYSQPNGGHEVPEFAVEHSPQHQNSCGPHQYDRKARLRHRCQ